MAIYMTGIVILLYNIKLWETSNMKDTIIWIFTVGFVLVFQVNEVRDTGYLKKILVESFKWTLVIEFITNLYTFSLLKELILVPTITFLAILKVVTAMDKKYAQLDRLLTNVLAIIGVTMFLYSLIKTFQYYGDVLTFANLVSLFLPIVLTILFIPFTYLLALYCIYETFSINIDFMIKNKHLAKSAKRKVILTAGLNINRLMRIKSNFNKKVFYDNIDLAEQIQKFSQKDFHP